MDIQSVYIMKSYFLEGVSSEHKAREALRLLLPGQERPWLLLSPAGDPKAYFNVQTDLDGERNLHVYADISSRYFNCDMEVLEILR
jgi:hypothetical protein